jgi:HK97 family phage prohead protease
VRLETKTVAARVTEAKADGTATALVSVFGNVDLGGDRVMPGAFTRTLAEWQEKGDPIPVIWSHDWDNPESFVGWADPKDITESEDGLVVPMQFDLDRPRAEQVHHLLKTRRVTQFSFGYFTREFHDVDDPDYGTVRELTDIDLFEVGPTLVGMNPETELIAAASALRPRRVKATPEEAVEGAFVTWTDAGDERTGRIEHVMTDGILGVPECSFQIAATADDPAILIRLFEEEAGAYVETRLLMGARASEVRVVDDPTSTFDEQALPEENAAESVDQKTATVADVATTDSLADPVQGDTEGTIPSEQVTILLTRTRHQED